MSDVELELVNFVCDKCGKNLVQALPAAQVLCRNCDYWVTQRARGHKAYDNAIQKCSVSVVCK